MPLNLDFTGMTEDEIDSYCEQHADEICEYAHSLDPNQTTPMTAAEQRLWRLALSASTDRQQVCDLVADAHPTGSAWKHVAKLLRLSTDEVQARFGSASIAQASEQGELAQVAPTGQRAEGDLPR